MSVQSAVRAGRRAAESLMSATVSVRRYTGETTMDDLGVETALFDVVYEGKARLHGNGGMASVVDVGSGARPVLDRHVYFPVGSFVPRVGDEVHVISDRDNPYNAGRVLSLKENAPIRSQETAYRVWASEVVNG